MQRQTVGIVLAIILALFLGVSFLWERSSENSVHDFESCVRAGNPVLGTEPRQCLSAGKTYFETDEEDSQEDSNPGEGEASGEMSIRYHEASDNIVHVTLPFPGATTGSDFVVRGEATSDWYVEDSFPVLVISTEGDVLAEGVALANTSRVLGERIPFAANMVLPQTVQGQVILVIFKGSSTNQLSEAHPHLSFFIQVDP